MKTPPSTHKLLTILDTEVHSPHSRRALVNAFACGCYLHRTGKKDAGYKMCRDVLEALGFDRRTIYFKTLLAHLEGNEQAFADGLNASLEISMLFASQ